MNLYEQIKEKELLNRKVTIIGFGEFGFLNMSQTRIEEINPKAHYENAPESEMGIELIHKPKRKRNFYSKKISHSNKFLIYDDWIDLDLEDIIYNKIDNCTRESKYTSFDKSYLLDVKKVLKDKNLLFEYGIV